MPRKRSTRILAEHIFDGLQDETFRGYIFIQDGRIEAVGRGDPTPDLQADEILRFRDEMIMPGLTDCHTFFTGYAVYHVGADLSGVQSGEDAIAAIEAWRSARSPASVILGHGWDPVAWDRVVAEKTMTAAYPDTPVVLFAADRGSAIMNRAAEEVLANIRRTIGTEQGKRYWNRRRMQDAGLTPCGATDLPLMIPDLPASINYTGNYCYTESELPKMKEAGIRVSFDFSDDSSEEYFRTYAPYVTYAFCSFDGTDEEAEAHL